MSNLSLILYKRELRSYFASPIAVVFLVIFLILNGLFTFNLGNFFERGQADLTVFFNFHPWLYLFLMPALAMGIWSEERKSGTIELLLTLPITLWQAALAKFLAAWSVACIALLLTFPIWLTVNYLGQPDNGVILASYLGSILLAGAYLAVGTFMSALTRNQVVAFISSVVICFLLMLVGFPVILNTMPSFFPQTLIDAIASLSFLTHFDAITKGVLDLRDVVYFFLLIGFWLTSSVLIIDQKKAQ